MKGKQKSKKPLISEPAAFKQIERAEKRPADIENSFRALVESANDGILIATGRGNYVFANKRAAEITGYSIPELLKRNIRNLTDPDEVTKVNERYQKRLLGESAPSQYETVIVRKDGQNVPIELTAARTTWEGQPAGLAVIRDITERKRAEKALRESEAKYRQLIDTSLDGVISIDSQMKITVWNRGAETIFGYTEKEMLGQSLINIVPEKYRKAKTRGFAAFRKTGSGPVIDKTLELEGLRKDGTEVPVELSVSSKKVGKTYVATAIVRDITKRKLTEEELSRHRDHLEEIVEERTAELVHLNEDLQREISHRQRVEEALRKSEEGSRAAFEHANDCIIRLDGDGQILNVNERAEHVFSISKEKLLDKKFLQLGVFSAKDLPQMTLDLEDILNGKTLWMTIRMRDKKGQEIYLECSGSPVKVGDEISGVTLVGRDITERKRAEEALKTAEREKAAILDSMSELVTYQDTELVVLWSNKAAGKSVGLPPEQLIGRRCHEIWQQREEPCVGCPVLKALETGHPQEAEMTSPDGRMWLIHSYPVRDENGELAGAVEVTLEITKQKRAEEALKESEEKFRTLAEKSPNMIFINRKGKVVYANKQCEESTGYTREEFYSPAFDFLTIIAPEYIGLIKTTFNKHMKGKEITPYEYALITKEGKRIEAIITTKLISYEGEKAILGIVTDITDRKRTEQDLQDSEIRLRTLFEEARDAVFIADTESGIIVDANKKAEKLLNRSRKEIIGLHQTQLHPADEPEKYRKLFEDHVRSNGSSPIESEVITVEGTRVPVEINASVIESGGKKLIQGIFRDMTERKKAEKALRESERRFRDITSNALEWVWEVDAEGKYTYASPVVEKILGYKPEEILQKHFYDLFHSENREALKKAAFKVFSKKQPFREFINPNVHKNGNTIWLSTSGVPILDENENLLGYRGADTDVTERKHAEDELRESEERYRDLFENANDLIQCVTPEGKFLYVNRAWRRILGYSEQEVAELSLFDIIHPDSQAHCQEVFQQVISGGKVDRVEAIFVAKDGREIIVEGSANCRLKDGQTLSTRGIFRDITERKRAEEQLKRGLERLQKTYQATVDALASSLEMRDPYTAGHQRRMTQLACTIAEQMSLSEDQREGLRLAGLIHDIGKVKVPAEILSKPGKLTETEYNIVKIHSKAGYEILKNVEFPWPIAEIVLQVHERLDGSGYPNGLVGDDILLPARILAVADVVESMASHRPYRPAHSIDEALEEVSRNRGRLYDPHVVEVCLKLFEKNGFQFPQEKE